MNESLDTTDNAIWDAINQEKVRQEEHIELIASENYTSLAVMQAQGSALTNKYAEAYPGKRYYGGCEYVDIAESLAIERAKALFGAGYANVQPHSGSQANAAVYMALIQPVTTRGMAEAEVTQLAKWMCYVLDNHEDAGVIADVKAKVIELCGHFPVYGEY